MAGLRGSVVVLHFWASWCPPCLDELPNWVEAARGFEGKAVKWMAVSLDESWQAAHEVLPEKGMPSSVISVLDPERKVADRFGSFQFPETYLIGPDQKIVTKWVGSQDWRGPGFRSLVESLLSHAAGAARSN